MAGWMTKDTKYCLHSRQIMHLIKQQEQGKDQPFNSRATLAVSFVKRPGFSSKTSIAVIAALARYGGKEAENTYPELLNRCKRKCARAKALIF